MNRPTWTPEEFERLLALPHDHPDRVRAESSLEFQARLRMHASFASLADQSLDADERAHALRTLGTRLEQALGLEIPAPPGTTPFARPVPAARAPSASPRGGWFAPAARPAFAFAAVVVAVGLGWWALHGGPAPDTVRGTAPPGAVFDLDAPVAGPGRVTLSWSATPNAESYRLVFLGDRLQELARVDGLVEPSAVLRAGALPAGLDPRAEVGVEVQVIAGGDVVARSRVQVLRLP